MVMISPLEVATISMGYSHGKLTRNAEVGSDEPNKSNATFAHDEMEIHG